MAKTNHQTGFRKPQKKPTTNYEKDSHKKFCKRCFMQNDFKCPSNHEIYPDPNCEI